MLPPSSPFSLELTISLLTSTLWLYTTLASYGMYASIAATASAQFNALSSYILSENCRSVRLGAAWAGLVGAWMVCATDPHRTTPSHDILWSQIVGWGWCGDVLELRGKLGVGEREREVWCSVWGALTAWLEGARVNGIKRGETERAEMISAISSGFESGSEKEIVGVAIVGIRQCLSSESLNLAQLRECATHADVLAAAIQLWLACVSHTTDGPPDSPPFAFSFSHISELCAALVTHPLWSAPLTTPHSRVACRSLTSLLSTYLLFSRRLPDTTQELWMAQAFSVLCRLLPGDEEFGVLTVTGLVGMITPELLSSRGWTVPSAIWQRGGLEVITPFLTHSIQTREGAYIGPLHMTPTSISLASTQRLPPINNPSSDRGESLPLTKDWVLSPLNHLLRSGTSTVFKYLPPSWDANEIDVTRATLLLAKIAREILGRFALRDFLLTREETVFGCMKVFMLEHEQAHNGAGGEVFRDGIVGGFMSDLIAPFTVKARPADANTTNAKPSDDLEKVASRFLGSSTPFYQYYTDFIALYDAISFSHPLFASLLLPPLSMRYAIDYRKLFWNDYGHVLKTIRTPVEQVVAKDLKEFLWPIESDSQVLSAQLRCLVKGSLHEFLRFLAVHHIASNVWPDLRCGNGNGNGNVVGNDEGAGRLLKAVMQQSPPDVVRDVLRYRQAQAHEGEVVLAPGCYEQIGKFGGGRVEFALRWADAGTAECVERLLGEA